MKYSTVISESELSTQLDRDDLVVVDCRFTLTDVEAGRRAYAEGHIPGAVYMHLNDDLSSPVSASTGRHPLPDPHTLANKLGLLGINNNTQVVAYDDTFGAMASRLWWLLRWMGHDAVALLDGGYPAWLRNKNAINQEAPQSRALTFTQHLRPELIVDAVDVEAGINSASCLVIDARSEERFRGEVEPLDKVAGHIPGAINLPFEDNLDIDGTFMSKAELTEQYIDLLGNKDASQLIMMCGSGVTACHNLVAMEIAGLTGARLYAGSWSEWITDASRPVATGD